MIDNVLESYTVQGSIGWLKNFFAAIQPDHLSDFVEKVSYRCLLEITM